MLEELNREDCLYQEAVVTDIESKFGEEFVNSIPWPLHKLVRYPYD